MRGARAPSLCALLLLLLFLSFLPGPADGLRQQPVPQGAHHANTFRGQVENAYRHFFSWLRGGRGGAGSGALQPPRLRTSPEREGVGVHGQSAGAEETDNDTEPNDAMLERGRGAEKHGGIFGFLQIWGPSKEHKLNFNRLIAAVSDKMDDDDRDDFLSEVDGLHGQAKIDHIAKAVKGLTGSAPPPPPAQADCSSVEGDLEQCRRDLAKEKKDHEQCQEDLRNAKKPQDCPPETADADYEDPRDSSKTLAEKDETTWKDAFMKTKNALKEAVEGSNVDADYAHPKDGSSLATKGEPYKDAYGRVKKALEALAAVPCKERVDADVFDPRFPNDQGKRLAKKDEELWEEAFKRMKSEFDLLANAGCSDKVDQNHEDKQNPGTNIANQGEPWQAGFNRLKEAYDKLVEASKVDAKFAHPNDDSNILANKGDTYKEAYNKVKDALVALAKDSKVDADFSHPTDNTPLAKKGDPYKDAYNKVKDALVAMGKVQCEDKVMEHFDDPQDPSDHSKRLASINEPYKDAYKRMKEAIIKLNKDVWSTGDGQSKCYLDAKGKNLKWKDIASNLEKTNFLTQQQHQEIDTELAALADLNPYKPVPLKTAMANIFGPKGGESTFAKYIKGLTKMKTEICDTKDENPCTNVLVDAGESYRNAQKTMTNKYWELKTKLAEIEPKYLECMEKQRSQGQTITKGVQKLLYCGTRYKGYTTKSKGSIVNQLLQAADDSPNRISFALPAVEAPSDWSSKKCSRGKQAADERKEREWPKYLSLFLALEKLSFDAPDQDELDNFCINDWTNALDECGSGGPLKLVEMAYSDTENANWDLTQAKKKVDLYVSFLMTKEGKKTTAPDNKIDHEENPFCRAYSTTAVAGIESDKNCNVAKNRLKPAVPPRGQLSDPRAEKWEANFKKMYVSTQRKKK